MVGAMVSLLIDGKPPSHPCGGTASPCQGPDWAAMSDSLPSFDPLAPALRRQPNSTSPRKHPWRGWCRFTMNQPTHSPTTDDNRSADFLHPTFHSPSVVQPSLSEIWVVVFLPPAFSSLLSRTHYSIPIPSQPGPFSYSTILCTPLEVVLCNLTLHRAAVFVLMGIIGIHLPLNY